MLVIPSRSLSTDKWLAVQKGSLSNHGIELPPLSKLEVGIPKISKDLGTLPVQRGRLAIQITEVSLRDNHAYSSFYVSKCL